MWMMGTHRLYSWLCSTKITAGKKNGRKREGRDRHRRRRKTNRKINPYNREMVTVEIASDSVVGSIGESRKKKEEKKREEKRGKREMK
jgi:hypothetical protein